jgi:hypothetical protein
MPEGDRKESARRAHEVSRTDRWAIGGIEREIAQTRERLSALTAQAARLRQRAGARVAGAGASARTNQHWPHRSGAAGRCLRSAQEDLRDDEEALGRAKKRESRGSEHEAAPQAAPAALT